MIITVEHDNCPIQTVPQILEFGRINLTSKCVFEHEFNGIRFIGEWKSLLLL